MSTRAHEIIQAYSEGREFAYLRSAEELLALAYDEVCAENAKLRRQMDEAREEYMSAVERRAVESVSGYEAEILPPDIKRRPGVWSARLVPVGYEWHYTMAHPSKWKTEFKHDVCRRAGEMLARVIFEKLEAVQ